MRGGQIVDDVLRRPASAGDHNSASANFEQPIAFDVSDDDVWRARGISRVLDPHDGRIESNACRLTGTIERTEVHSILPDCIDSARTDNRSGDESLHHQTGEHVVSIK